MQPPTLHYIKLATQTHTLHIMVLVAATCFNQSHQNVSRQKRKRFRTRKRVARSKPRCILFALQRPHLMMIYRSIADIPPLQAHYRLMNNSNFLFNPLFQRPLAFLHIACIFFLTLAKTWHCTHHVPAGSVPRAWTTVVPQLAWVHCINTAQWQHRTFQHLELLHVPSYRSATHIHLNLHCLHANSSRSWDIRTCV